MVKLGVSFPANIIICNLYRVRNLAHANHFYKIVSMWSQSKVTVVPSQS